MNENYVEVFNVRPEMPVPLLISIFGDWPQAVKDAAREPFVEIVVYDRDEEVGTVVYSDDPDVQSGGWWAEAMRSERQRIGR